MREVSIIARPEASRTDDSARATPPVASRVLRVAVHAQFVASQAIVFAHVLAAAVPGALVKVQSCAAAL